MRVEVAVNTKHPENILWKVTHDITSHFNYTTVYVGKWKQQRPSTKSIAKSRCSRHILYQQVWEALILYNIFIFNTFIYNTFIIYIHSIIKYHIYHILCTHLVGSLARGKVSNSWSLISKVFGRTGVTPSFKSQLSATWKL